MIENNQAVAVWNRCLSFIKDNVNTTAYNTWFEPIVPLKYENKALTIGSQVLSSMNTWKKSTWDCFVRPCIKKSVKGQS